MRSAQPAASQQKTLYNAVVHAKGGDIPLTVHMSTTSPKMTLSLNEVTKALAQVPYENMAILRDVYAEPDSGLNAYTVGQTNTIVFNGPTDNQRGVDRVTLHETGHLLEYQLGQSGNALPGGDIGDQWKAAMASDGFRPSNYAATNDVEDFAESERLYQEVVGTANEAESRAMFPARFALLDRVYNGDLKKYAMPVGGDSGG